jgi:hypothetical protein
MILDNDLNKTGVRDKAESVSGNVNTERIKRDTSLYNTFIILELASALIKPINTSGL